MPLLKTIPNDIFLITNQGITFIIRKNIDNI